MFERGGWLTGTRRGVSEVIGVVLLVAIVVILAGTVAWVVTGVQVGQPPTPQFSKIQDYNRSTDGDGQTLEITHGSGEIVETEDMRLVIEGAEVADSSDNYVDDAELDPGHSLTNQVGDEWEVSETITLNGTTMRQSNGNPIAGTDYLNLRGASVQIVWVPENEGTSEVLFRWEGPNP